jgi:hypothetical protein
VAFSTKPKDTGFRIALRLYGMTAWVLLAVVKLRMVLTLKSPLPRLRLERQMESGEDCLSSATSHVFNGLLGRVPQPPRCGAKTKGYKRQRSTLLFGYFLLSKQKQSNSPRGEKKYYAKLECQCIVPY